MSDFGPRVSEMPPQRWQPLTPAELVAWTAESIEAIATRLSEFPSGAPVPACPKWTVDDLLGHVAQLMAGWYRYNLTRPEAEDDSITAKRSAPPYPAMRPDRIAYLRAAFEAYRSAAEAVDLTTRVWTILAPGSPLFWITRAAVEMALHRWDLEDAAGRHHRMLPRRATHAVDETLRLMWPAFLRATQYPHRINVQAYERPRAQAVRVGPLPKVPLGLWATDTDMKWSVSSRDEELVVDDIGTLDELPPTAISASAHDLELFLWGRLDLDRVNHRGATAIVRAWHLVDQADV